MSFDAFTQLIARLRGPGGCPWDREQTHESLKPFLIEETYEVLEALDKADPAQLKEELGDLLLQVALHAQIAQETGNFNIQDVIQGISDKLVRRHPHIFGDAQASDARQVIAHWEELKREERGDGASILEGIPRQMPALAYSQALQHRAARVGFEWPDLPAILDKLAEEVQEIKETISPERRLQEFGDLLFVLADSARWLGVDGEEALRQANERFRRRFNHMEGACRSRGVELSSLNLEAWTRLWEEAKETVG
ncbi:MAG: nucleoside triphosphate pyrophosphohydrolase [Chloroflexi bacterium]|nr:nucleoside triphosphate pyrophosphohydrolase [Chloroflexota bacterium]